MLAASRPADREGFLWLKEETAMPTPNELRRETLKTLRATRRDMASAAWHMRLRTKPTEVQRQAAHAALDIESAVRSLENEQLADIRDKFVANEADLLKGINDLNDARQNLARVESIIRAAGKALDVLAKVISFAATRLPI